MEFHSLGWKKMLASFTGVFTRWKVKWALWTGWEGEKGKKIVKSNQPKSKRVMWGGGRVECPWKDEWKNFLSHSMGRRAEPLNREEQSYTGSSPGCRHSSGCQVSGCCPVICLVCLNMARAPGNHCRPQDLAIWTPNPKYIFSHYRSILYLQGRDKSPNKRRSATHGIIMTQENTLPSGWELWSAGLCSSLCCSAILSVCYIASQSNTVYLDFPECEPALALGTKAELCSFLLLLFPWLWWPDTFSPIPSLLTQFSSFQFSSTSSCWTDKQMSDWEYKDDR